MELIGLDELRAARDELSVAAGERLVAVALGTPHASLPELEHHALMLGDRRVHPDVELLIATGRDVLAAAEERGVAGRLRAAGAELLVDTCSYLSPALEQTDGAVMTDSAKWAWYGPANLGARPVLGSTAECVRSAVAGRIVRHDALWGAT